MKNDVEARLISLEERVAHLEMERPGRRRKPIVVSEEGVCGLVPERDSASCHEATVYRRQQGCRGTACELKAKQYYAAYRKSTAAQVKAPKRKGSK